MSAISQTSTQSELFVYTHCNKCETYSCQGPNVDEKARKAVGLLHLPLVKNYILATVNGKKIEKNLYKK